MELLIVFGLWYNSFCPLKGDMFEYGEVPKRS